MPGPTILSYKEVTTNWKMLARYCIWVSVFFLAVVNCFTTDEVEVFQLQKNIVDKYGKEMNLYKFLKLDKLDKSTNKEITKQFRSLSRKYHPDKSKKYGKLYERLNLAAKVLTDHDKRKVYDYYLKQGFPDYQFSKGGFVFIRPRPSTLFLFCFVYFVCCVIHWCIMKAQNNSNKRRIMHFIEELRGHDNTNGLGECKLSFKRGEEDEAKTIVIRFGDVYIVQPDGSEDKVTVEEVKDVTLSDNMLIALPRFLLNFVKKLLLPESKGAPDDKGVVDKSSNQSSNLSTKSTRKKKSTGGNATQRRSKKD